MKADSLWGFKASPPRDEGEVTQAPELSESADAPGFARALEGQTADDSPTQEVPDGDNQYEWDGRFPGGRKALDASGHRPNPPSSSSPSPQAMAWAPEATVAAIALPDELLPDADGAPNGSERSVAETSGGKRSDAPPARSSAISSEIRPNLSDEGASAAGQGAREAIYTAEAAPAPTTLLGQATLEPGVNLAVLARAAHIVIGTEDGRSLELHLRLSNDRSEIRAAGALAHVIRARLAELELVLAAQGVPLAGFEVTDDDEEEASSDPDEERAEAGRGQKIFRAFRTKA